MELNTIDDLGIERVLSRGTGRIQEENEDLIFVHDSISDAYMLSCKDPEEGRKLLEKYHAEKIRLLFVRDHALGLETFEKYGFTHKLECYQVAYYGESPAADEEINVRSAEESDLPFLKENYHALNDEELSLHMQRKSILLGYHGDQMIGFIGEHLEGSMGILFVLPEYRNKGYGIALQNYLMRKTLEKGYLPFGQVEKDNLKSLNLQKKLGMTVSDSLIVWMWRE